MSEHVYVKYASNIMSWRVFYRDWSGPADRSKGNAIRYARQIAKAASADLVIQAEDGRIEDIDHYSHRGAKASDLIPKENEGKPITRAEWRDLASRAIQSRDLDPGDIDAIEATIENGGFAPEPVTETKVLEWVYNKRAWTKGHNDNVFHASDLGAVITTAIKLGWVVTLQANFPRHKVTIRHDTGAEVTFDNIYNLAIVALTVAAVMYADEGGPDVTHLVGEYAWELVQAQ